MDRVETWLEKRMQTIKKPSPSKIDELSRELERELFNNQYRLHQEVKALQELDGLNVSIGISSTLFFADDCAWKQEQRKMLTQAKDDDVLQRT